MGKKATILLVHYFIILITIICAALAVMGWFAGYVSPKEWWLATWISLGMLPLLIVNLLFLVYWSIKLKFWFLIPLSAIMLNIGFITAMFQIDLRIHPHPENTLKIASYNIFEFEHNGVDYTSKTIAKFLKDENIDVVCFQEFSDGDKLSLDSIRSLLSFMPYNVIPQTENGFQLAVFSKYPITAGKFIPFHDTDNSAMWVDVNFDGKTVRIFNNHLQTTSINQNRDAINQIKYGGIIDPVGRDALGCVMSKLRLNFGKRVGQVASVRSVMDTTTLPMIVCGDFNDTPASHTYHQMKKGLTDGFKSCGSGYGYTFRSMRKILRLDYILYSNQLIGIDYFSPSLKLSDHNPVILEFAFRD